MSKRCPSCKLVRKHDEFYRNRARLDGLSVKCWECHLAENKRAQVAKKALIFAKYGGKCQHCGFADIRALQIDHVNGGGRKEHAQLPPTKFLNKVLHDESGAYQLLCANCNWIKRSENKEQNWGPKARVLGDAVPVKAIAPPGVNAKKWWASLTGDERSEFIARRQRSRAAKEQNTLV